MEKEFIPYKQALALKELGFDEECFRCKVIGQEHLYYTPTDYDDFPEQKEKEVLIPTFSQAFRWFREEYKIECYVNSYWNENDSSKRTYYANYNYGSDIFYTISKEFETHEEAELECLKKLIEIVKDGRS